MKKQELLEQAQDLLLKFAVRKQMAEEFYEQTRRGTSVPWRHLARNMKDFYTYLTLEAVKIVKELR